MADDKYYTVQEVSSLLQVHWQSVLNYIKSGKLEAVKLGRGYRIGKKSLDSFIASHTTGDRESSDS
ncbi:MAG TPA: helix-turn-helix domain-containing protein [Verrucomicrobiae bacterium]|nr:helix-turn-helix domain-containing protein [Verrucomicrobiae bacterium]